MITADKFLIPARELGFNFFTGTPCSYLKPFINYVIDADGFDFIEEKCSHNDLMAVRYELIQVAAVTKAFIECIDRNKDKFTNKPAVEE